MYKDVQSFTSTLLAIKLKIVSVHVKRRLRTADWGKMQTESEMQTEDYPPHNYISC